MTRYYVQLATVVVLSSVIGSTSEPVYAQPPVGNDGTLSFSGWKMYSMNPSLSRVREQDVDVVLTGTGRFLVLTPQRYIGYQGLTEERRRQLRASAILNVNISDIYQWGSVYAQERLFDQRQVVRVFYRDNGVNRYAIIGRPDNNRDDDLEWLILTSELQIRTGMMSTF